MSFATAKTTVQTKFFTEFPVLRPAVRIAKDNEKLSPPPDADELWTRFMVRELTSTLMSIGGPPKVYDQLSQVVVEIFAPTGQETTLTTIRQVADDVSSIYRGQGSGLITYFEPKFNAFGQMDVPLVGVFYKGVVFVDFIYELVE